MSVLDSSKCYKIIILFTYVCVNDAISLSNTTSSPRQHLINEIMQHKDFLKLTFPMKNPNDTLMVYFGIALHQILHMDENKQVLECNLWIRENWKNEFLVWDPADYDGIKVLHLPPDTIWNPDITLYNNADIRFKQNLNSKASLLVVHSDGQIYHHYNTVTRSTCVLNIKYFPFDEQICELKYGPWSFSERELEMKPDTFIGPNGNQYSGVDYISYRYNSEWGLVSLTAEQHKTSYGCCPDESYGDITFLIRIRRRWMLYFFYLIIPNLLINITAITQFLLPCDSGEKISLSITIYLSMVVYLLIIQDILPSAESIPVIVQYIVSTMVLVALSQSVSTIVLQLHHGGNHKYQSQIPHWARTWILHRLASLICFRKFIIPDKIHNQKLACHVSHLSLVPEDNARGFASASPSKTFHPLYYDPSIDSYPTEKSPLPSRTSSRNSAAQALNRNYSSNRKTTSENNLYIIPESKGENPQKTQRQIISNSKQKQIRSNKNMRNNILAPRESLDSQNRSSPTGQATPSENEQNKTRIRSTSNSQQKQVLYNKNMSNNKVASKESVDSQKNSSYISQATPSENERNKADTANNEGVTTNSKVQSVSTASEENLNFRKTESKSLKSHNTSSRDSGSDDIATLISELNMHKIFNPREKATRSQLSTLNSQSKSSSMQDKSSLFSWTRVNPLPRHESVGSLGQEIHHSVTLVTKEELKKNQEMLLYKMLKLGEAEHERTVAKEAEREIFCEWQQIAMVIDRFMFWLYLFCTITLWMVMILIIPRYREELIL